MLTTLSCGDVPAIGGRGRIRAGPPLPRRHPDPAWNLDRTLAALRADIASIGLVGPVSAAVTQAALALLTRHPLRTGDSVQIASCLHLRHQLADDVRLLAYDARLNDAARVEGITLMAENYCSLASPRSPRALPAVAEFDAEAEAGCGGQAHEAVRVGQEGLERLLLGQHAGNCAEGAAGRALRAAYYRTRRYNHTIGERLTEFRAGSHNGRCASRVSTNAGLDWWDSDCDGIGL